MPGGGTAVFFDRVTIIGVGLVGASLALALRSRSLCKTLRGYGRREEHLREAVQRGIVDAYSLDAAEACENADLVVLATPVGTFREIIDKAKGALKPGTIVTDVGSVKGALVHELESLMPDHRYYVGTHPIAGGETSGIGDARADIFEGARCIITPTEQTNRIAADRVAGLWESVGAVVECMDPHRHDVVYAAVSHLPHLIAYALVNTLGSTDEHCIVYAGQGFKDTTRIALSSPELWRDISLYNSGNLVRIAGSFRASLEALIRRLEDGDAAGLEGEFAKARQLRMRLK